VSQRQRRRRKFNKIVTWTIFVSIFSPPSRRWSTRRRRSSPSTSQTSSTRRFAFAAAVDGVDGRAEKGRGWMRGIATLSSETFSFDCEQKTFFNFLIVRPIQNMSVFVPVHLLFGVSIN